MPSVVPQLTDAGVKLITVAECLDLDPYKEVGEPQERDETWVYITLLKLYVNLDCVSWSCDRGQPAPLGA